MTEQKAPLILGLDSTSRSAAVAVCRGKEALFSRVLCAGNTHSETLLPMVEQALKALSLTVNDLDLFACAVGPGSFTGVRIGTATVKGLAFGRNRPCIGVSSLEALAENLRGRKGLICASLDARRGQVYGALFSSDGKTVTRLTPDMALEANLLCENALTYGREFFAVGDGAPVFQAAAGDRLTFLPCTAEEQEQNAVSVCRMALQKWQSGEKTDTDITLSPIYLRLPQAERERQERLTREKAQKRESADKA